MTTAPIGGMFGPGSTQTNLLTSSEFKETRTIEEDLQSGTIVITLDLPGRTDECYNNQLLQGFHLGDPHPFYRYSYLVRRKFVTIANRSQEDDRLTRVICTYKKRPCTNFPEMSSTTALVSVNTWWTYEDPPVAFNKSPAGYPIQLSQDIVTLRWPYIELSLDNIMAIKQWSGHLLQPWAEEGDESVDRTFYGENCRDALLEGIQRKLLYGDVNWKSGAVGAWELSLQLRIDPWRHHQRWTVKFQHTHSEENPIGTGDLEPITTLQELRDGVGHNRYKVKPAIPDQAAWDLSLGNLGGMLTAGDGEALCGPPNIGSETTMIGKIL